MFVVLVCIYIWQIMPNVFSLVNEYYQIKLCYYKYRNKIYYNLASSVMFMIDYIIYIYIYNIIKSYIMSFRYYNSTCYSTLSLVV